MQNYFRPAEPARGEDEAPVKLGKRKKDPDHFWTGLLTLVSGSLGMNPVFKCMSYELDFQGTTRAAVHLHARVDPKNHVRLCPNITAGSDEQKDIMSHFSIMGGHPLQGALTSRQWQSAQVDLRRVQHEDA